MGKSIVPFALAFLLAGTAARAEDPAPLPRPGEMTLAAERAVVFKDGNALIVKRATGAAGERGEIFTEEVPDAAILGSFWAIPDGTGPRLRGMDAGVVTSTRVSKVSATASRMAEVLAWNVEEEVTLELDDRTTLTGTVREVLPAGGAEMVVLQASTGNVLVPLARVRRLDMKVMRLAKEQTVTSQAETKRLTFSFEGGAGERSLSLLYFRPGIRWIPTYRIVLPASDAAGEARLALQAEILNEAEDLLDVPFDLVVGVPNFRFGTVVSPFVLEPMLRDALREGAPQLMGLLSQSSNVAFRSRAGERLGGNRYDGGGSGTFELPPELTTSGTQDFFVYSLPKMTLLRGHRAAVPIFEATSPLKHVYTWDVAPVRDAGLSAAAPGQDTSPLTLSAQRIWHQLELTNATRVPWTTGAAFVMREGQPLAQDLLTYTPRGATTRLPLTVAVDVRGEYGEEETARALDAMRWTNHTYARIDRKGSLAVMNHKDVPIDVEVTLRVGGKVDEASEGASVAVQPFRGEDWREYRGDPAVNNSSEVRFRVALAAKERKEFHVAFHYFVLQ